MLPELFARADVRHTCMHLCEYVYVLAADGEAVLCPSCKGSYLMLGDCGRVIRCSCGLRVERQVCAAGPALCMCV
jgi:hypothetical protein